MLRQIWQSYSGHFSSTGSETSVFTDSLALAKQADSKNLPLFVDIKIFMSFIILQNFYLTAKVGVQLLAETGVALKIKHVKVSRTLKG